MSSKWTIVGQILDSSGYANHTRQLFNALAKENDVKLITGLTPEWLMNVNDKELEAIKKEDSLDRIKIIITHPVYWRVNATNKRNWAYCVWEGHNVPKSFIEEMLNPEIEKIIVPSQHTSDAIQHTLDENNYPMEVWKVIGNKTYIIPHGVNHEIFKPKAKDKNYKINREVLRNFISEVEKEREKIKPFVFLVNKGWRNSQDRGGSMYAVRAFIEEFTDKDNVKMLIKVNPAYGVPDFQRILHEYAGDRTDLPEIVIDVNNYKYEHLVNLYNQADVFVSTTRAEGFNLPVVEAFACGLPAIVTNFGGQTDFVNEENGWLIDYKLEEVKHEVQYEGNFWATPSIVDIRKTMRNVMENWAVTKRKGEKALEKSKEYDWKFTAQKFVELA